MATGEEEEMAVDKYEGVDNPTVPLCSPSPTDAPSPFLSLCPPTTSLRLRKTVDVHCTRHYLVFQDKQCDTPHTDMTQGSRCNGCIGSSADV